MKKVKDIYQKIKDNSFYKSLFKNSFWAFTGDFSASLLNLVVTIILRIINNTLIRIPSLNTITEKVIGKFWCASIKNG